MNKKSTNSIFTSEFWTASTAEFRNLKSLAFAGLTIALGTVLSFIYIPVGVNLKISFAFLVLVFGSMIFGPTVGLAAGLAYDLIGYFLFPSGVFFPGYTLSTMLEFFVYGIFLYRNRITVLRISLMKVVVDLAIHVGLGSLWSEILYGKGYYYFFARSIIKNIIMLPIEVIMIVALLQTFLPILVREGFVPKQKGKYIAFI